jgi:hypothetical protein
MGDAARRLGEARDMDLPQALAVISEAVGWVTMVDATVVRYHPDGGDLPVAEWTWLAVPAPAAGPTPKAREWEMSRYRQYRARLAGQPVGHTVGAAVAFLSRLPAVGDHAGKNSLPA